MIKQFIENFILIIFFAFFLIQNKTVIRIAKWRGEQVKLSRGSQREERTKWQVDREMWSSVCCPPLLNLEPCVLFLSLLALCFSNFLFKATPYVFIGKRKTVAHYKTGWERKPAPSTATIRQQNIKKNIGRFLNQNHSHVSSCKQQGLRLFHNV